MAWELDPSSVVSPTGIYADSSDLDDFYGIKNIDAYSDLADTDTRDNARIQKFLTYADQWINLAFKQVGRATPIASDADDFSTLTRIAAEWAGAMLAKGRGDLPDKYKGDAFDSFMDGHIERAQAELDRLVVIWEEHNPDLAVSDVTGDAEAITGRLSDNTINHWTLNNPRGFCAGPDAVPIW